MSLDAPMRSLLTNGVFIAACAVALALETSLIAGSALAAPAFYAFLLCATAAAYRLHALARGACPAVPARRITWLTIAAAVALLPALPPPMLPWIGVAAACSWAYSLPILPGFRRLRQFGLAKIVVLAGVWTLVTAYLPLQSLGLDRGELSYLLARRFLFMFALCLAFDVRDHAEDARSNIRTLPVRVGIERSFVLMRMTLLSFAGLVLLAPFVGAHHPAKLVTIALFASALLTWFTIERTRRGATGRLYHLGWVDGMMALQSALVGLAAWASALR